MQTIARLSQPIQKGIFIPIDTVIREENSADICVEKRLAVFENLMGKIGIEANGLIEIKSEIDPTKKVLRTGPYAINSVYILLMEETQCWK